MHCSYAGGDGGYSGQGVYAPRVHFNGGHQPSNLSELQLERSRALEIEHNYSDPTRSTVDRRKQPLDTPAV
jgi:hypothetical protein